MNRIRWYGPSIVLLITVVATMALGPHIVREIAYAKVEHGRITNIANLEANSLLKELSQAYTDVAEAVEPSVVHIEVLNHRQARQQMNIGPDELREWFFGPSPRQGSPFDNLEPEPQDPSNDFDRYNPNTLSGNGAGWVYDSQGHIITNNHVVQGADEIQVRFFDGAKRKATVVGTDPRTDVAVLKVEGDNLHPAVIEDEPVRQGEIVFAFGSPFRFEFSMSQGIVSAKGRQLDIIVDRNGMPYGYEKFIQTDAAINPGNSGGPLTNIEGKVVGMNTAIASRTGAYNGLGFAIPAQIVTRVADQLIADGKVRRGYLGVYIHDLTPTMAKTFGYDGDGVLVSDPIDNSPAQKAGLKAGDIITHVADKPVTSADELRFLVAGYTPDSKIELTLFRDGKTQKLTVTLGELPDETLASAPRSQEQQPDATADQTLALRKLGIEEYQSFTSREAEQLQWEDIGGVAVTRVRPGSIAANEGIRPGVIITQVFDQPIKDADDLHNAIDKLDLKEPVRFTLAEWSARDKQFIRRFVVVEIPQD